MADVFYDRVFHPLRDGAFSRLVEVCEELSKCGETLDSVQLGTADWAALDDLEERLSKGAVADQFYRHRYLDEGEDDSSVPERCAFSYHWKSHIFAGLLVRETHSGLWDLQSPLIVGDRVSGTYLHDARLVRLADILVRNTEGTVNDQTASMRELREHERAASGPSPEFVFDFGGAPYLEHLFAQDDSTGGFFSSAGRRLRRWAARFGASWR